MCGKGWWWGDAGGRPGLTRKPFASRKPCNVAPAPVLSNLITCTLNPTPNPKLRLNAGSKPRAEHTPQIFPKPLSTRSRIPSYRIPKTQKLLLYPIPQNPTTTHRGKRDPTPHTTGIRTRGGRGGGGRGARDHI